MRYYVDFEGSIMIEADSKEEAIRKFWEDDSVNLDEAGYLDVTGTEKIEEDEEDE